MVNILGQVSTARGFVPINFSHTTPFDTHLSFCPFLFHCCLIVLFELVLCQVTLGTYLLSAAAVAAAAAASSVRLSFNSPYSSLSCFLFFLSLSVFFLVCYILMQTHISCFINSNAAIKYATYSRNMWELQVKRLSGSTVRYPGKYSVHFKLILFFNIPSFLPAGYTNFYALFATLSTHIPCPRPTCFLILTSRRRRRRCPFFPHSEHFIVLSVLQLVCTPPPRWFAAFGPRFVTCFSSSELSSSFFPSFYIFYLNRYFSYYPLTSYNCVELHFVMKFCTLAINP